MGFAIGEYDPGQVVVDFNGILLHGFADGTMIKVMRDEDAFFKKIGADGEGIRVKNRNRGGSVTFSLGQQSAANDLLSAQAVLDESSATGKGPLLIKDLSGRTLVHAKTAWIKKLPDTELSKEASDREWVLDTDNLELTVGGN